MTPTLASRIRAEALECGYWTLVLDSDRRACRKDIAVIVGCTAAAVLNALKRSPKIGRPKLDTTQCSRCGQPLPARTEAP